MYISVLVVGLGLELGNLGILLGLDASLALVAGELGLALVAEELGLALVGLVGGRVLLGARAGNLPDLLVDGLVELLEAVGLDAIGDVGGEALLVLLDVLLLQVLHVLPDVAAEELKDDNSPLGVKRLRAVQHRRQNRLEIHMK